MKEEQIRLTVSLPPSVNECYAEIWLSIPWYENLYEISNLGRVKSLPKRTFNWKWYFISKERILKPWSDRAWYKFINLTINKISKYLYIHRLVWLAFIENKLNKKEINHVNHIKHDNRVENLEWVTRSENVKKSYQFLGNYSNFYHNNPNKWKKIQST